MASELIRVKWIGVLFFPSHIVIKLRDHHFYRGYMHILLEMQRTMHVFLTCLACFTPMLRGGSLRY